MCVGHEIEDDELADEHCDHEDYDADILTGLASCGRCGARWVQTKEEIERQLRAQADYDAYCEEVEKPNN